VLRQNVFSGVPVSNTFWLPLPTTFNRPPGILYPYQPLSFISFEH
jgi:hypothetical protein